ITTSSAPDAAVSSAISLRRSCQSISPQSVQRLTQIGESGPRWAVQAWAGSPLQPGWGAAALLVSAMNGHLLRPRVGEHPRRTLELASRAQRELAGRVRDRGRLMRAGPVVLVAEVQARVLVAERGPVLLQPLGRCLAQVSHQDQGASGRVAAVSGRLVVDAAVAVVGHPVLALEAVRERRPFSGFGVGLVERGDAHRSLFSFGGVGVGVRWARPGGTLPEG